MKIVCESCGAKYSIADERVSGKMFKIRCKRCSEVIIVRGDQQAQPAAEPAPVQAAQDAIWHVVVEGEQAGPYSPSQLGEMLTSGAVDWDAYVWTEGFDNWVPMRDVEDLVAQITGQAQPQAAAQAAAPAYRPNTQTLTGQPSMGADPFADDAAPSDAGLFGGSPAGGGADLFARGAGQQSAGGFGDARAEPGLLTSSPSPRMAAERVLTGARNENSVLFSLKNLQALATGSGSPSAPPVASFGGGNAGGFAAGEGSGLIDIRALATTTAASDGGEGGGHKDELLSIGSQGGAFGTLGSPMLTSMSDDSDSNKKTVIWAVVAGLGLVCTAGVVAAYILKTPAPAAPSVAIAPAASAQGALVPAAAAAAVPTQPAPAAALSEGELAAKRAAEQDKSRESDKGSSSHSSGDHHHKHGTEGSSAKSGAGESEGAAEPEPKKTAPKGGPRSIDELLDGALSGSSSAKGAHAAADTAAKSNLPDTPSREQVMSAMSSIKPAVQACAKGAGGVVTVTVNVAGASGRVTTAEVNGITGPAGSCIAQAARKAQFPKFAKAVFKLSFPYKL